MTLKAILFGFSGTLLDDADIQRALIAELLLGENLRPSAEEFDEVCLGRSDRACLRAVLGARGRVVDDDALDKLLARKSQVYRDRLASLDTLPTYPDTDEFVRHLQTDSDLALGILAGLSRAEVDAVLERARLADAFDAIATGDDLETGNPDPEGYWLLVERLQTARPELDLQPQNCLAIEASYVGLAAAQAAGMQTAGVAHAHPLHMLQRQADWAFDNWSELAQELDRVRALFAGTKVLGSQPEGN